uniref:Ribosomal protein S2 n=1 Tax=Ancoracysta twista TaxID=2044563 RepID=A0A2H4R8D4_9EUKA|nr:ribosomal protein S2 [Ancoracysta twista]ATY40921.1 ribosomal protein S2 [Ancoracysta twista]
MHTSTLKNLLEAGAHLGHRKEKVNPQLKSIIMGERGAIHLINLEQTIPVLRRALILISDIIAIGGDILIVGSKGRLADILDREADKMGQPYCAPKWAGGLITNWNKFEIILKRQKTQRKKRKGALGLRNCRRVPDLIVIMNGETSRIGWAVKEANSCSIPVVAIADTNVHVGGFHYRIPSNDDSRSIAALHLKLVKEAVQNGLRRRVTQL